MVNRLGGQLHRDEWNENSLFRATGKKTQISVGGALQFALHRQKLIARMYATRSRTKASRFGRSTCRHICDA